MFRKNNHGDRQDVETYCRMLPFDVSYEVTIEEAKTRLPSNLQSRISILIRELAQFCGYAENEFKAIIKAQYYPHIAVLKPSKLNKVGATNMAHPEDDFVEVPVATMKLSPSQAREVEAHLYNLGAEIGCPLSIPQASDTKGTV